MIIILAVLFSSLVQSQSLDFYLGDKKVTSLSIKQLEKIATPEKISLSYHGAKSKIKNYRAFKLKKILSNVLGTFNDDDFSEVILEATDGYKAFSETSTLLIDGGYIAFKDLDVKEGWEPVGRGGIDPGPFYMVWKNKGQTSAEGYPWPWNLKKIRFVNFKTRYPTIYPQNKRKTSSIFKGFQVFKSSCFKCHALNKVGGKIGPDLGAPQNILDYRSEKFVKAYIKNPEAFRYSKMPAHDHLSKQEVNDIVNFLKYHKAKKYFPL